MKRREERKTFSEEMLGLVSLVNPHSTGDICRKESQKVFHLRSKAIYMQNSSSRQASLSVLRLSSDLIKSHLHDEWEWTLFNLLLSMLAPFRKFLSRNM